MLYFAKTGIFAAIWQDIIMDIIIGRDIEKQILTEILDSPEAELLAVYGRRRVGKTYLIRTTYAKHLAFEFTGIHNANLAEQLENFTRAMWKVAGVGIGSAKNWLEAFAMLEGYLGPLVKQKKQVIFLDEFPWIHTRRSNFLQAFAHFWNTWASRQLNLIVVICGSSASWMIQRVFNDKGGLHNRVTKRMRLLPFTLAETAKFLHHRGIRMEQHQILELFMAMGGVPQYLKEVKAGESPAQAINRICFSKDGFLRGEFPNLFRSLFDDSHYHTEVIRALSKKSSGMTRNEIIEECSFSSGGGATNVLEELTESGFITPYTPFDRKLKESIYKLTDEYSLFYAKFISNAKELDKNAWQRISDTQAYKTWSGYAYESICIKHIMEIKQALGIEGVNTGVSIWRFHGTKDTQGAQIDLLIDRQDKCINLCEIKFVADKFAIDKKFASELDNKVRVFKQQTKTRKTIFPTLITTYGTKKNDHYVGRVQAEVVMADLFK
jgi:predicted AAA+ superfamily ATPase